MPYLDAAFRDGHAELSGSDRSRKILYRAEGRLESLAQPEEAVRAEFWAELIYRYGYDPSRIALDLDQPGRADAADIVVFADAARTRPFAVIECKPDGVSDTEFAQAIELAVANGTSTRSRANYVGVVAGGTRLFLDFSGQIDAVERETNVVADLPSQYGLPEEFKYRKGGATDIAPVTRQDLIAAIRKCHQTLWGGGRLSPPSAFGELCKLIFVKIADEQVPRRKGEPYAFQIKTHEPSRALAERIRGLYERQQELDPEVFTDSIRVSDAALRTIVSHLESIDLGNTDLDTKGVAFEQFMDSFFKGDFGQYFTPRTITAFCVEMVKLTAEDKVIDPACGSGGFLLYALDKVRQEAEGFFAPGSPDHYRHWHDFARQRLFGIEINDEIARVAKMNMILHDDGHTNVVGADALEHFSKLQTVNPGLKPNSFDVVLSNPPFGATVSVAEHPYLGSYRLAHGSHGSKLSASMRTEILFIERIAQLLKHGSGRAAIVLPDGVLTNKSTRYVREYLLEAFQLMAVVSLPATAFTHYGAGVKASVVVLRRRAEGELAGDDELVFMSAPESIGYDSTGREAEDLLPSVALDYREFLENPKKFVSAG